MKLIKPNNQIKNAINPNKTQIKPKNPAGLGFIKKNCLANPAIKGPLNDVRFFYHECRNCLHATLRVEVHISLEAHFPRVI